MTACPHRIVDDPTGLACLLDDHPDTPRGHSYESTSVPDRHYESSGE